MIHRSNALQSKQDRTAIQAGFSVVEVLVVFVVVGLILFAGLRVMGGEEQIASDTSTSNDQSSAVVEGPINNAEDLEQTEQLLEEIKLDDLDASELEAAETELL